MAIFRSSSTPDDVYKELKHAIESQQHYIEVNDVNLANMWGDEIKSIVKYCEENMKKLGIE
jgi:hypothetical protein